MHIRSILYSLIALLPLALHLRCNGDNSKINSNNDHGIWLTEQVETDGPESSLFKNWHFIYSFQQRWGADYKILYFYEYQFLAQYNLTSYLKEWFNICPEGFLRAFSLGAGYRAIHQLKKNTLGDFHWVWGSLPLVYANINFEVRGWKFNNRLMGQYIEYSKQHYKAHGTGRYRLWIYTPWKFTRFQINPWINNEWFFRNNTYHKTSPNGLVGGWYQNRFRVGLSAVVFETCGTNATADLFWQYRTIKHKPGTHPRWFKNYDWGANFALSF